MLKELTGVEGKDSCSQVTGIEWHVNTRKGNGSKAMLQLHVTLSLLLLLSLLETGLDDVSKHLLDFLNSEDFRQL